MTIQNYPKYQAMNKAEKRKARITRVKKLEPQFIDTNKPKPSHFPGVGEMVHKPHKTMLTTILSLAKRIIKPKKLLGKLLGAVTSFFSIPALGSAIGLTSEIEADALFFTAIVFVAGYFFNWSWEQMKEIITFLNSLSDKVEKKKSPK